jgi:hypothetical protein
VLASSGPPRYQRRPSGSLVDGFELRIRELLQVFPRMPSTVIAERIGWPYSIRTLSGRVAELRPVYLPPDLSPILHDQHLLPPWLDSGQGHEGAGQFSVAAPWSVFSCRRQDHDPDSSWRRTGMLNYEVSRWFFAPRCPLDPFGGVGVGLVSRTATSDRLSVSFDDDVTLYSRLLLRAPRRPLSCGCPLIGQDDRRAPRPTRSQPSPD